MKATSLLPPKTVPPAPVAPTTEPAPIRTTIAQEASEPRKPSNTVTKRNIAARVAASGLVPAYKAEDVITEVCAAIVEALRSGKRVELRGFGTFKPREVLARGGFITKNSRIMPSRRIKTATFHYSNSNREVSPVE